MNKIAKVPTLMELPGQLGQGWKTLQKINNNLEGVASSDDANKINPKEDNFLYLTL